MLTGSGSELASAEVEMRRVRLIAVLVVLEGIAACGLQRPAFVRTQTPHEADADGLRRAGLVETALGRDWLAAAEAALRSPTTATLPVTMTTAYPAAEPRAFGYRLTLQRGRVLRVEVTPTGDEPALVFLDLFRVDPNPDREPRHIESADRGALALEREIDRDGDYLLRIQPELLRSGTFRITQSTAAALQFPVEGRTARAVQSFFRDERDAGRREHHGIDIFAPRRTPVLAAAGGIVTSVGTNNLGGNVVWLWDPRRGLSHYYAHLDSQAVSTGQAVQAGDLLGYVGNTGNARTTAPHLHFGLYARGEGPIDPLPFVE
jgi:peptidoglycan LD-endopeptidase LytH